MYTHVETLTHLGIIQEEIELLLTSTFITFQRLDLSNVKPVSKTRYRTPYKNAVQSPHHQTNQIRLFINTSCFFFRCALLYISRRSASLFTRLFPSVSSRSATLPPFSNPGGPSLASRGLLARLTHNPTATERSSAVRVRCAMTARRWTVMDRRTDAECGRTRTTGLPKSPTVSLISPSWLAALCVCLEIVLGGLSAAASSGAVQLRPGM